MTQQLCNQTKQLTNLIQHQKEKICRTQKIFDADQQALQKYFNNQETDEPKSQLSTNELQVPLELYTKDNLHTDSTDLTPTGSCLLMSPENNKFLDMAEMIYTDEPPKKTTIKINIHKVGNPIPTENDEQACSLDDLLDSLPRVEKNVYSTRFDGDKSKKLLRRGTFNRRRKKGDDVLNELLGIQSCPDPETNEKQE